MGEIHGTFFSEIETIFTDKDLGAKSGVICSK
jgi:hypothetical protein